MTFIVEPVVSPCATVAAECATTAAGVSSPAVSREHGTRTKYATERCRCPECCAANAAYKRDHWRHHHRPDVVALRFLYPSGQVVAHLAMLREAGIGTREIARRAGINERTVKELGRGRRRRVRKATKEALMAVMPSGGAPGALVPTDTTGELLVRLYRAGMTEREVAAQVHGPGSRQLKIGARYVTRRTAERVAFLAGDFLIDEEQDPDRDSDPLAVWRLLLDELEDDTWRDEAECRRLGQPVEERLALFFPERGDSPASAREVCARCPVQDPCRDYALRHGMQGVWGSSTGQDRRLLRRSDREDW